MNFQKIEIGENATVREILEVFESHEAQKIILSFPRDFQALSESAFLKKLKNTATQAHKELILIINQKVLRDIVKKQGLTVFSILPQEYSDGDWEGAKKSADFSDTPITESQPEEEILEPSPDFSLSPIPKSGGINRAKIFFGGLGVVLFGIFVWLWNTPSAVITIKPKLSPIPLIQNVLVVLAEAEINEENEQLPKVKGITVQTIIQDTEIVVPSGREYEMTNAKGKLTLYNETNLEKFLVPSRLRDTTGVIVRTQRNVTIPPKQNGKAGQIVVEVVADEYDEKGNPIGIRGNLDAGTELYFPALREDLKEVFYARTNKGPLVGGSTLTKYIVVEEDVELAKQQMLENFRDRGIQELMREVEKRSAREDGSQILLEKNDLLKTEVLEYIFPTEKIGEETQTFSINGKVRIYGIVFDQAAVKDILQSQMIKSLDDRQKIITLDETSLEYEILDQSELEEKNILKLSVKIIGIEETDLNSSRESAELWRNAIKEKIRGKSFEEATSILINIPEIEQVVNINTKPFWQKSIPVKPENISFKTQKSL